MYWNKYKFRPPSSLPLGSIYPDIIPVPTPQVNRGKRKSPLSRLSSPERGLSIPFRHSLAGTFMDLRNNHSPSGKSRANATTPAREVEKSWVATPSTTAPKKEAPLPKMS